MRVLHLAAGNRWTGAAAPAFAEVEALRAEGFEAHYAYVGGYKLEEKLRGIEYAHPIIEKAQNPFAFRRTLDAIRGLIYRENIRIVHAHLTYDHWLARFLHKRIPVARTFHSRRTLRNEPLTRSLIRHTDVINVVNERFLDAPVLRGRALNFTPPPVDMKWFRSTGDNVRARYGFDTTTPVVTVIGKVARGRGFEAALRAFAHASRAIPAAKLMIIGHGPHRPALEEESRRLGIESSVVWAGYHEDDLPEHYRAADVLLFTAKGSDEGHRAVLEAMACGIIPSAYPIEGLESLLGPKLAPRLLAVKEDPEALGRVVVHALESKNALKPEVILRGGLFRYEHAADRLIAAYTTKT